MIPETSELPLISVDNDQKPELLVMKREDEVTGWAIVFPDGSAWLLRTGTKSMIHSGSIETLISFWSSVFDAEIGIPVEE